MYTSSTSNEKAVTLFTENDWHLKFARSGVAEPPTGINPNVQVRLINVQVSQSGVLTYPDFFINPYLNSFEFDMEVLWIPLTSNDGGDNYTVRFGNTKKFSIFFNFWNGYGINENYPLHLRGEGVYILNSSGYPLAKGAVISRGPGENQWFPVKIIYNKNAAVTWSVYVNNVLALTYTDSSVSTSDSWHKVSNNKNIMVSAHSGGGLHMQLFVRKLNFIYKTTISANTMVMPPKFYPSADDSTFSSNRAAYARSIYPRIANDASKTNAEQITKQKRIYNRHDASSRIERLKLQAIGESSMRLKEDETLSFKAPNVNDARDALRRTRSHGYIVPPKGQK
jgi:hypothetical protein